VSYGDKADGFVWPVLIDMPQEKQSTFIYLKESAFAIAVFAQMPRLFGVAKTLDRICDYHSGEIPGLGRLAASSRSRAVSSAFSQLRVLAAWRIILPSSSVPCIHFGVAAAPMIDIRVPAGG
jgi:hypothetical protein